MNALIRNGTVVTAHGRFRADVRVTNGKVAELAATLAPAAAETVVDATDRLVLPGGIDVHTHLDMPFMGTVTADDFATGTTAAAVGGTTTIVDFVIPTRGQPLLDALETWHGKARGKAVVDYGFHMALVEFDARVAGEIPALVARGVTSFKCFLAYKGALIIDDAQLLGVLTTAREAGALVSVHAENGDMLVWLAARLSAEGKLAARYHEASHPPIAEAEATARAIALAEVAGAPLYVVHLSCAGALAAVRAARARGQAVFAETCPQYLVLDASRYLEGGFEAAKWVMSPPLRDAGNQPALWAGLADGTLQTVATDHCSFHFRGQKDVGGDDFRRIPNGAPGLGERLSLLWTAGVHAGRLTAERFVDLVATGPARLFGLAGRKGDVAVGADGDLLVFDPRWEGVLSVRTAKHRCDYSSYEGVHVVGRPAVVLARGEVVAKDGEYVGRPGRGEYVARAKFDMGGTQ